MSLLQKLQNFRAGEATVIHKHQKKVADYNKRMLLACLIIFGSVLPLSLCVALIIDASFLRITNYMITQFIIIGIILLYRKNYFDRQPLTGLYVVISIAFFYGIILSVSLSPDHRTTVLLSMFCILPLLYIDKTEHKVLIVTTAFVAHTIAAFILKDASLAIVDTINSLACIIVGLFSGYITQKTRLDFFQLETQLLLERETDILTGLKNKRKMYELFGTIEQHGIATPSCVMMIDVDHFKQYNDTYGHAIGDDFLRCFGATLLKLEQQFPIQFYRYGGEEIAAFLWDCPAPQQEEIAQTIRSNMNHMTIEHKRTLSIGYVDCLTYDTHSGEHALELADIALYHAKNTGRNKVVAYHHQLSA